MLATDSSLCVWESLPFVQVSADNASSGQQLSNQGCQQPIYNTREVSLVEVNQAN